MNIIWHGPMNDDDFMVGRNGSKVDKIVLHTMCSWISGAESTFRGPRVASAHYGVRIDGSEIWQWVDEKDTAYQAGNWDVNLTSIGIEHEDAGNYDDPRPDALYTLSAQLVADICKRYNIPCVRGTGGPGIYDHRAVGNTRCPDALDTDRVIREAAALVGTPAPQSEDKYHVLCTSTVTATQLKAFCPTAPDGVPELYIKLANEAGIRPEIPFAQAVKETARFTFLRQDGTPPPSGYNASWHNPAGLGVTGAPDTGNRFDSWEQGIRAQLGHLLWYFGPVHPVAGFCDVDQRHFGGHKNLPNDIRQLNGKWAVPGPTYGESIAEIAKNILAMPVPQGDPFWARPDSTPLTLGDLREYSQRLQIQLEGMK